MAKITSYAELEKQINKACSKAVQNTCNKLLEVLQQYIMSEYYDVFNPKKYHRTMQFYRSAMTEILSETCGIIFMNPDAMYYPIQKTGWSWDGALQIYEANEGSHGGWTTEESVKHKYFYEFEKYCAKNAVKMLKQELIKQGIPIK